MSSIHRLGLAYVASLLMFPTAVLAGNTTIPISMIQQVATAQTATQSPAARAWSDVIKESIEATRQANFPNGPEGNLEPSDLTLDSAFGSGGMVPFWPPYAAGSTATEDGLRVFSYRSCNPLCMHGGYYVVGRQQNTDNTWRAVITRRKLDGTIDSTFGTDGWMYTSVTGNLEIVDAAMGNGKMYVLTTMDFYGVPIMRVICKDLATGSDCFGLFGGYATFGASADGAVRSAYARRIVYDSRYGLHIAGRVFTVAHGWEVGVARLDADTGAHITEFGGSGKIIALPDWAAQTAAENAVYDLTVVPSGTPGGERLYVAGMFKRTPADHDGYVLGLNPNTAAISYGWAWPSFYFESDNTGNKRDAITAITVQRNGGLAMAGWTETNVVNEYVMILARARVDGILDSSFCGDTGICRPMRPMIGVVNFDRPVAIAERSGNRDLVVAAQTNRHTDDHHLAQSIYQFSSTGRILHAQQVMDFGSYLGASNWSHPFGMWMGATGLPGSNGPEVVAIVGTRHWKDDDYDMTLSKLIANDSIFADQFGGSHGD